MSVVTPEVLSPPKKHANALDDFVGMFRRRGVGEMGEVGRLHHPRIIRGNAKVVEVSTSTNGNRGFPLTPE